MIEYLITKSVFLSAIYFYHFYLYFYLDFATDIHHIVVEEVFSKEIEAPLTAFSFAIQTFN